MTSVYDLEFSAIGQLFGLMVAAGWVLSLVFAFLVFLLTRASVGVVSKRPWDE